MHTVKSTFQFRPYTKKELRGMYGVSKHVFNKLIAPFVNEIGIITGKFLTVKQVEVVVEKIGIPKTINIE